MKGYIKLHRKIVETKYYKKSQYTHLWLHLLLRASHSGSKWKFKGREYIKRYEKVKQITKKTYNKCSVIQILNWKNYQTDEYKSKTKYAKRLHYNNDNNKPLKSLKKFIS